MIIETLDDHIVEIEVDDYCYTPPADKYDLMWMYVRVSLKTPTQEYHKYAQTWHPDILGWAKWFESLARNDPQAYRGIGTLEPGLSIRLLNRRNSKRKLFRLDLRMGFSRSESASADNYDMYFEAESNDLLRMGRELRRSLRKFPLQKPIEGFHIQRRKQYTYRGFFLEGAFHGEGELATKDGQSYSGNWDMGKRNGLGMQTWTNGDHYNGNWANDVFHGKGTFSAANGVSIKGTWACGLPYSGSITLRNKEKIDFKAFSTGNDCLRFGLHFSDSEVYHYTDGRVMGVKGFKLMIPGIEEPIVLPLFNRISLEPNGNYSWKTCTNYWFDLPYTRPVQPIIDIDHSKGHRKSLVYFASGQYHKKYENLPFHEVYLIDHSIEQPKGHSAKDSKVFIVKQDALKAVSQLSDLGVIIDCFVSVNEGLIQGGGYYPINEDSFMGYVMPILRKEYIHIMDPEYYLFSRTADMDFPYIKEELHPGDPGYIDPSFLLSEYTDDTQQIKVFRMTLSPEGMEYTLANGLVVRFIFDSIWRHTRKLDQLYLKINNSIIAQHFNEYTPDYVIIHQGIDNFSKLLSTSKKAGKLKIGFTPWLRGNYAEVLKDLSGFKAGSGMTITFFHMNRKDYQEFEKEVDRNSISRSRLTIDAKFLANTYTF
jgi:hypothetical protein